MKRTEEWNQDEIVSHVDIRIGWLDRLRILFRGLVWLTVRVKTENVVGKTESDSSVNIKKIFPRKSMIGVAMGEGKQ